MVFYTGVEQRPRIENTDFHVVTPGSLPNALNISSNFESTRVIVADAKGGSDGKLYVYDYDDVWSEPTVIDAPTTGATNFGCSVSMDFDGTRVAVGASTISTVYVYDLIGTTWTNVKAIEAEAGGTDFGFSVSLAVNNSTVLCVGAPLGSNVFVYEQENDDWLQKFWDNGKTIKNRLPLTPTSNVILKNELSRYGFHVCVSPNGNHIVAGAPGFLEYEETIAGETYYDLTEEHIEFIEEDGVIQPINTGVRYKLGALYYQFQGNIMRQLGNARVFSRGDAGSWGDGNPATFKLGPDIEGDPGNILLTTQTGFDGYDSRPNRYDIITGWSFPALGTCTYVSDELVVILSSPLTPTNTDRGLCTGTVNRFKYTNDVWVYEGNTIASPYNTIQFGTFFSCNYPTERIFITGSSAEIFYDNQRFVPSVMNVLDWNGSDWTDAQPTMSMLDSSELRSHDRLPVYSPNGEHIVVASSRYRTIFTKHVELTQLFTGNSLFSGYVSTRDLFIGINSSDDTNASSKKISFGGTFRDQAYDLTTIENRSMIPENNGRSELLLAKKTGSAFGTDFIRIKSNEIHLDTFRVEPIIYRNPDETIYGDDSIFTLVDDKIIHSPVMVINTRGCVCINHPITPSLRVNDDPRRFAGSVEAKAFLDVNGDAYIRNKLTINYTGRSELKGDLYEPYVFYDTRDPGIMYIESGTTRAKSKTMPYQSGVTEMYGVLTGDVAYSDTFKSFEFGNGGTGKIQNFLSGTLDQEPLSFTMWIMLQNPHGTYTGSNCFSVSSIESFRYKQTKCTFQVVSTGFKVLYEDLKNPSNTFSFSMTTTIPTNTWTHIDVRLPGGRENTPAPKTSNGDILADQRNAVALRINSVICNSWITEGTPNVSFLGFSRVDLILGGNLRDAYIGQFMTWNVRVNRVNSLLTYTYDNGPPTEMLAVGGDAIIERHLGIGTTLPEYPLDVVGNTRITGSLDVDDATAFTPISKLASVISPSSYNYILNAPRPGTLSGGAVHFINGSARTDDGGVNTYTIRNDSGTLRLGSASYDTIIDGDVNVGGMLYLDGATVSGDSGVDADNKTNTYIKFGQAGSGSDWAYLRQIGGDNAYHMALDFHDDGSDARFSIRDVHSTGQDPDIITTRFTVASGGNVGIGTASPQSRLTINPTVSDNNFFDHGEAPLTITQPLQTSTTTLNDPKSVLHLTRQGTGSQAYGARASFKLSRYENVGVNSRTRLDLDLSHESYDDVNVMTLRSDGKVGIGTTSPIRKLDVRSGTTGSSTDWISGTFGGTGGSGRVVMGNLLAKPVIGAHNSTLTLWETLYLNNPDNNVVVDTNGRLGIGTATPTTFFHTEWFSPGDSVWYEIWKHSFNSNWAFSLVQRHRTGVDASFGFRNRASNTNYDVMTFLSNKVGINNTDPQYALDVSGTIRASGDIIAFSDGRYKTDVRRIDGALEKVGRVSGYTFRMKDETERRAGVIAQEIREVLPEVVVGGEEAGYNVAYGNMAGLFIEAIKELKARVETLEAALRAARPEGLSPE